MSVDVEGMERGWPREALGRDGLDDVARANMRFQGTDVGLIACLTDVGGIFVVLRYWWLMWERDVGRLKSCDQGSKYTACGIISLEQGGGISRR